MVNYIRGPLSPSSPLDSAEPLGGHDDVQECLLPLTSFRSYTGLVFRASRSLCLHRRDFCPRKIHTRPRWNILRDPPLLSPRISITRGELTWYVKQCFKLLIWSVVKVFYAFDTKRQKIRNRVIALIMEVWIKNVTKERSDYWTWHVISFIPLCFSNQYSDLI